MKTIFLIFVVMSVIGGAWWLLQQPNQPISDEKNTQEDVTKIDVQTSDKTLDLQNQNLMQIPSMVFKQVSLEHLNVSHNRIDGAIQAEIRFLQNLRTLDASDNQMTGIPAEIGQLQKLEVLDLSNNKLTGLPYELGHLKNLQELDLSGNAYSEYDLEIIKKSLPSSVVIITNE